MRKTIEERLKSKNRSELSWENLYNFMDENEFSCLDFLAVICASLLKYKVNKFNTELMLQGVKFKISITKE
jgi:hypothetical protein